MQQLVDFITTYPLGCVIVAFILGFAMCAIAIWAITHEQDDDDFHLPPNKSLWN